MKGKNAQKDLSIPNVDVALRSKIQLLALDRFFHLTMCISKCNVASFPRSDLYRLLLMICVSQVIGEECVLVSLI